MSPQSSSMVELLVRGAAAVDSSMIIELPDGKIINPYGYYPTLWVCALFVALFGLSTILHLGQALSTRKWYLLPTIVLGGCGEVIGWVARLWSAKNIGNPTPFLMQVRTTIISPTFLAGANFIILGTIIKRIGPQYSRLAPNKYGIIFVTIDILALWVQAAGGGMASSATQKVDGDPSKGGHVMLIGIVIQLVEIFIYAVLAAEFFYNYSTNRVVRRYSPAARRRNNSASSSIMDDNLKWMSYGLFFSTVLLFIRAIYRTIELSNGWHGRIIHTQIYFNILDGAMVALSMYTINLIHPGILLS
ncbi:RTA1-domain-containing protein [Clavulina sp. PMI_390]|nr:RTA1-domain-containing protein [Clavulina sp. PMI_390]